MRRKNSILTALFTFLAVACASNAKHEPSAEELARRAASSQPTEQVPPAFDAARAGPTAVAPVAALLASEDPAVAKRAEAELEAIVHGAAAPDRVDERRAVNAELLRQLDSGLPAAARCSVLRLLGASGDDGPTMRAISARLADPELADAALFALTRARCEASTDELVAALSRAGLAVSRADLARALDGRNDERVIDALLGLAERGAPSEAVAARATLSRSSDPRVEPLLVAAAGRGVPNANRDLLRYAEHSPKALALYESLLRSSAPHERAAALRGIARTDPAPGLRLIVMLGDDAPEVRAVAREALVASTDPKVPEALVGELHRAAHATRAAEILRVLVARRDPGSGSLVRAAVESEHRSVRIAALELAPQLADPSLESALIRSLRASDAGEREVAARGLLAYARAHQTAGQNERALQLYHLLLDGASSDAVAVQALAGVAVLARPESLDAVRAVADRGGLVDAAARARVAIVAALPASDRELAVRELEAVVTGDGGRSVRNTAAQKLAELGVDTSTFTRRRGVLVDWYLCGPFPAATADDFGAHPFGASALQVPDGDPASFPAGLAKDEKWTRYVAEDLDGVVDLTKLLDPHDNVCAYALARVIVPATTEAVLKLGSDDGVAVWLDGRRVHSNNSWRGLTVDEDTVPLALRAGEHTLLIKVNQGGGGWEFCARLCDPAGRPLGSTAR